MIRLAAFAIAATACGGAGRATAPATRASSTASAAVTLYRDTVEVREQRTVALDGSGRGRVAIAIDGGVTEAALDVRVTGARTSAVAVAGGWATIDVAGAAGAEAVVGVVYTTPRLVWSLVYSAIRDGERTARIDAALEFDNQTGVAFAAARLAIVDDKRRGKSKPSPFDAGVVAIDLGGTRIGLGDPQPADVRDILVFDPIGAEFDSPGSMPQRQRDYGLTKPSTTVVVHGYRVLVGVAGLPPGPIRLYARGARGELVLLGAGRLGAGGAATIATSRIEKEVIARRGRTDYFLDDFGKRLIEELTIAIDNHGARAVDVVVLEHLYRGEQWQIAYASVTLGLADKEDLQQVAMTVTAAPRRETKLVYRVVYWWK